MMCIVIRANRGVDWINGLDLGKPYGKSYQPNRHHVFPHSQLKNAGYNVGANIVHRTMVNEIANRVTLTKAGNMGIFDKPPEEYFPEVEAKNPGNLAKFMIPADPILWRLTHYPEFLKARRQLIADQINSYLRRLREPLTTDTPQESLDSLLKEESSTVEFKSTLRFHIQKGCSDGAIERAALKTICAFMNTKGGTLLIGVNDKAEVVGLDLDYNSGLRDRDKWELHLTNLLKDQIGASHMSYVDVQFQEKDGKDVAVVRVKKASVPAYLKKGQEDLFFVRTGNNTTELGASHIAHWIRENFQ
jgi:hypothetical protein